MNIQRLYYTGKPRGRTMRWRMYFTAIAAVCMLHSLSAQDLINNGTLTNNGRIRVKNQTTITQASVGGEIELNGADQNLPAKQYQHVCLSGTGTKTATGGNLSILGNLTIASPVTLNIPQGSVVTLGDTLFESGRVKGAIQKSVNLTGSTTSSNFGNIGATISWSSNAPGITNVIRVSDSIQSGNGNQSIKRFYQIQPAVNANGTITFKFADEDLNGHDIRFLQLWESSDSGASWIWQGGDGDTLLRSISITNAGIAGMWTMADSLHPIGTFAAPGTPKTMAAASAGVPTGQINTVASPFSVVIRDAFNTPLKNIAVTFTVDSIPAIAGATRPTFSDTVAVTDSLGIAKTNLTFGNKAGTYYLHASAGTLPPVYFTAKALPGSEPIIPLRR